LDEGGWLANALIASIETGLNVGEFFLQHAHRLAAAQGCAAGSVVPDDIYEQAGNRFDWQAYRP